MKKRTVKMRSYLSLILALTFSQGLAGSECTWDLLKSQLEPLKEIKNLSLAVSCAQSEVSPMEYDTFRFVRNMHRIYTRSDEFKRLHDENFSKASTADAFAGYIHQQFVDNVELSEVPANFDKGIENIKKYSSHFLCLNSTLKTLETAFKDASDGYGERLRALRSYISLAPPEVAKAFLKRTNSKIARNWNAEDAEYKKFVEGYVSAISKLPAPQGVEVLSALAERWNKDEADKKIAVEMALNGIKSYVSDRRSSSIALPVLARYASNGQEFYFAEIAKRIFDAAEIVAQESARTDITSNDFGAPTPLIPQAIDISPPDNCNDMPNMSLDPATLGILNQLVRSHYKEVMKTDWNEQADPYNQALLALTPIENGNDAGKFRYASFVNLYAEEVGKAYGPSPMGIFFEPVNQVGFYWCRAKLMQTVLRDIKAEPDEEKASEIFSLVEEKFAIDSIEIMKQLAISIQGKGYTEVEKKIVTLLGKINQGPEGHRTAKVLTQIVPNLEGDSLLAGLAALTNFKIESQGAGEALFSIAKMPQHAAHKDAIYAAMAEVGGTYLDLNLTRDFEKALIDNNNLELKRIIDAYGKGNIGMKTPDHKIFKLITDFDQDDPQKELKLKLLNQFLGHFVTTDENGKKVSAWGTYNEGTSQTGSGGKIIDDNYDTMINDAFAKLNLGGDEDSSGPNPSEDPSYAQNPGGLGGNADSSDGIGVNLGLSGDRDDRQQGGGGENVDNEEVPENIDRAVTSVSNVGNDTANIIRDAFNTNNRDTNNPKPDPVVAYQPPPVLEKPRGGTGELVDLRSREPRRATRPERIGKRNNRSGGSGKRIGAGGRIITTDSNDLFKVASNAAFDPLGRQAPIPLVVPNNNPAVVESNAVFGSNSFARKSKPFQNSSPDTSTSVAQKKTGSADSGSRRGFEGGSRVTNIPTGTQTVDGSQKNLIGQLKGEADRLKSAIADFKAGSKSAARFPASVSNGSSNSNSRGPASVGNNNQSNKIETPSGGAKSVSSGGDKKAAKKVAGSSGGGSGTGGSAGTGSKAEEAADLSIVCTQEQSRLAGPIAEPMDTEDMEGRTDIVKIRNSVDESKLTSIMANPESLSCSQVVYLKKFFKDNNRNIKDGNMFVNMPSFDLKLDYPGGEKMAILESCYCNAARTAKIKKKAVRKPASKRIQRINRKGKSGVLDRMFDKIRSWF